MAERRRRDQVQIDPQLEALRERLQAVDQALAPLLKQRFDLAQAVGEFKLERGQQVYDQRRELAVLSSLAKQVESAHLPALQAVWRTMIQQSRQIQYQEFVKARALSRVISEFYEAPHELPPIRRVGYVGVAGSPVARLTEVIGFPDIALAQTSFRTAFAKLADGEVDALILPLEDSIVGSFTEVYDLLAEHQAYIARAIRVNLPYKLLVYPGRKLSEIQSVASHPRVLEACSPLILNMGWNSIEARTTVAAAQLVSLHLDMPLAAIATDYEAVTSGLEALPTALPRGSGQSLRYVLVTRQFLQLPQWSRVLLTLKLPNQPRALAYVTSVIGDQGINIEKLRTHASTEEPWNQKVNLELTLPESQTQNLIDALTMLEVESTQFKILGLFPEIEVCL